MARVSVKALAVMYGIQIISLFLWSCRDWSFRGTALPVITVLLGVASCTALSSVVRLNKNSLGIILLLTVYMWLFLISSVIFVLDRLI